MCFEKRNTAIVSRSNIGKEFQILGAAKENIDLDLTKLGCGMV